jgi:hypothetical protein
METIIVDVAGVLIGRNYFFLQFLMLVRQYKPIVLHAIQKEFAKK